MGESAGSDSTVRRLATRLRHRGPDGAGSVVLGGHALAHQRLAIVDVAGGAQPLHNEDASLALVCNGEIYNQQALRRELTGRHRFATDSDSEVIVHLYEELGAQCVTRLQGMFAFVVTDGRRFVAARDPLGIKPLYYGYDAAGSMWLASELGALADTCNSLHEFPAGHWYDSEAGWQRYYDVPAPDTPAGEIDAAALRDTLSRAVCDRLMSDVPLGVFLSGGLDSSLIAALVRPEVDSLHSFAVGLSGAPDLAAARQVADYLGTIHHEYIYTPDEAWEALPTVVAHLESYDPALMRSAVPCYFVSRLAAQYVKVVLSGEGSDELFGGYTYLRQVSDPAMLHRESRRILAGLHNMNLQRVDRMTMAHGLEGRVPFLDTRFVQLAMGIDPRHKLHRPDRCEKWALRQAFEGYLPDAVLWRAKQEFAQGAGSEWTLRQFCDDAVSDTELADAARCYPEDTPQTKEELHYRRLFETNFPSASARETVGRWHGAMLPEDRHSRSSMPDHTSFGERTYQETVARGFYGTYAGGLRGKYDNLRLYWEDQLTRLVLRPLVRERMTACRQQGRGLRIVDLGCGAGEGLEILTKIDEKDLSLDHMHRRIVSADDVELYLGLDLSEAMVQQGQANYRDRSNIRFEVHDLRDGLAAAKDEAPFDIYFSSYGAMAHLDMPSVRRCLRDIVTHARDGSLVVIDVLGRLSPEWPRFWQAVDEEDKLCDYSMSYLYTEAERRKGAVEHFPLRLWTGDEIRNLAAWAQVETGVSIEVARVFDRSLLVGRHIDTGEYGTPLRPLRGTLNRLHEDFMRTDLRRLIVEYRPVEGDTTLNAFFAHLIDCWNEVVDFTCRRLEGERIDLVGLENWSEFPPALQMALMNMDRVVDSVAWMSIGDARANIIEPQLSYTLRNLEFALQQGRGCGHGLVGVLQVHKQSTT